MKGYDPKLSEKVIYNMLSIMNCMEEGVVFEKLYFYIKEVSS